MRDPERVTVPFHETGSQPDFFLFTTRSAGLRFPLFKRQFRRGHLRKTSWGSGKDGKELPRPGSTQRVPTAHFSSADSRPAPGHPGSWVPVRKAKRVLLLPEMRRRGPLVSHLGSGREFQAPAGMQTPVSQSLLSHCISSGRGWLQRLPDLK